MQVSDLDTFPSREEFVAALTIPERSGEQLNAVTMSGDRVSVELTNMSIAINGKPRAHPPKMLHGSGPMKSVYGSGKITITTQSGSVTFDSTLFRPEPVDLPKLPEGMTRWGKPS